jgi:SEC-C motif-containing protein
MDTCPCGSNLDYASCCQPIITGERRATTAEQLMRSRYSAYVKKEFAHIFTSLHPDHRADYDESSSRAWAENAEWEGIRILKTDAGGIDDSEGQVEFVVSYREKGVSRKHHELSTFLKKDGVWYFATGKTVSKPVSRETPKTGRNEPCACGSGKKYKKCCGA